MHKFLVRAASGIIYAAVIIFALWQGAYSAWLLAAVFAVVGIVELDRMQIGISNQTLPIIVLDILGVLSLIGLGIMPRGIILWLVIQIVRFIVARRIEKKSESVVLIPSFGQVYIGIPFAFMIFNSVDSEIPRMLPLLVFVMLWLNDSGAYIVGSLLGRHKLCPKISPKKTWEGFFGGLVVTMMGAWVMFRLVGDLFDPFGVGAWFMLAACTCIFGTLGDLLESKIKRKYGFKDSGHWIPGHGGLLDRIDSFLIAYPVAFLLIFFLQ